MSILFLLLGIPVVQAQGSEPPIPASPADGNYVLDELDWLTSEQEMNVNSIIRKLDQDGVAEIAVVTLNDCGSNRLVFRKELFDTWGIGHASDNDGILILVCWYDGDPSRRSVEQLYGRGLKDAFQSVTTDDVAQQRFVPAFQAGQPGDGLVRMVRRHNDLLRYAEESRKSTNPLIEFIARQDDTTKFTSVLLLAAALLVALDKILPSPVRDRIRDWTRSGSDDWRDGGGSDGGFGGGNSDGGGGSSTRF